MGAVQAVLSVLASISASAAIAFFALKNSDPNSTSIKRDEILAWFFIFGIYSLHSSYIHLPFLGSVVLTPLVGLACYTVVRAVKGIPATMKGNKLAKKYGDKRYQLIAMPITHFGEKTRWVMDLIGAPYDESTVAGLLTIFLRGRSVPWLVDRQSCSIIGNSDEILMYLRAVYVPTMSSDKGQAEAEELLLRTPATQKWEKRLNDFGHAIQGWAYYFYLGDKTPYEYALTAWGAFEPRVSAPERFFLKLVSPILKILMRRSFNLDSISACGTRRATINKVLDRVDEALDGHTYIMGEHLSYIDITFCALLAPLMGVSVTFASPSLYAGGRFGSFSRTDYKGYPDELVKMEQDLLKRPCGRLVVRVYKCFRKHSFVDAAKQ